MAPHVIDNAVRSLRARWLLSSFAISLVWSIDSGPIFTKQQRYLNPGSQHSQPRDSSLSVRAHRFIGRVQYIYIPKACLVKHTSQFIHKGKWIRKRRIWINIFFCDYSTSSSSSLDFPFFSMFSLSCSLFSFFFPFFLYLLSISLSLVVIDETDRRRRRRRREKM